MASVARIATTANSVIHIARTGTPPIGQKVASAAKASPHTVRRLTAKRELSGVRKAHSASRSRTMAGAAIGPMAASPIVNFMAVRVVPATPAALRANVIPALGRDPQLVAAIDPSQTLDTSLRSVRC